MTDRKSFLETLRLDYRHNEAHNMNSFIIILIQYIIIIIIGINIIIIISNTIIIITIIKSIFLPLNRPTKSHFLILAIASNSATPRIRFFK